MFSLGKYLPTLFSATNENNLALASVKFDFSLVKIDAPKEFSAVGTAITTKRREQAEDGSSHKTARRLGALFEQLAPATPKLISAYGMRVSDIIHQPGVNPEGLDEHGPFKDYVGVDATGIWAAATSGISAIAAYMLACIIARLMEPKAAIALWVELVSERKKQIREQAAQNYMTSESTLFSAQQEITREELALWDNTARSWIRSADEARRVQIKQMELMIDNLAIPYHTGSNTYTKVIETWVDAMKGVEYLLQGQPQEAQTLSVPIALLSWHLFPNLVVLSDTIKHVPFDDFLFAPSATLTIGVASRQDQALTGTKWSLALSHFAYYGSAIQVQSEELLQRLSVEQMLVVALGALTQTWSLRAYNVSDMQEIAVWFQNLSQKVIDSPEMSDQHSWISEKKRWLYPLFKASEVICRTTAEKELLELLQLYRTGQRRAWSFLVPENSFIAPFFGLRHPSISLSLTEENLEAASIAYLRDIAKRMNLTATRCCIVHRSPSNPFGTVLLTAIPLVSTKRKRGRSSTLRIDSSHESYTHADIHPRDDGYAVWTNPSRKYSPDGKPVVFRLLKTYKWSQLLLEAESYGSSTSSELEKEAKLVAEIALLTMPLNESECAIKAANRSTLCQYLDEVSSSSYNRYQGLTEDLAMGSLMALALTCYVYKDMEGTTISTNIFNQGKPIGKTQWSRHYHEHSDLLNRLPTELCLACVIYMDSGIIDVDPSSLRDAIGVSRENSMYVRNDILADPSYERSPLDPYLKKLTGNLGQSGASVLIGPKSPVIRQIGTDFRVVNHVVYDGSRKNSFQSTSLHMQLTGWTMPMSWEGGQADHAIDHVAHLVEVEIKLREKGQWVADVDLPGAINILNLYMDDTPSTMCNDCKCAPGASSVDSRHIVSLDNWDELLDPPLSDICIFRAQGNWAARLGALAILNQKGLGKHVLFAPLKQYCPYCLTVRYRAEPVTTWYIID